MNNIPDDPQDIAVSINYMEQAAKEKDQQALDDLYDKLQEQIDSFYDRMCEEISPKLEAAK